MCPRRYRELMYKVVDGRASDAETAELRAHLSKCKSCTGIFERVRALDSLLREGMSERRFDGLWEQVSHRLRRRRVAWYIRVGAVAAAAALLLGFILFPLSSTIRTPAFAEGRLLLEHEGSVAKVPSGTALPEGAVVRNPGEGVVSLKTRKGSRLFLGVESALRLLEDEKHFSVCLLSGQIRVKVNHEPLKVVCNGVEVSVCGTDFVVRRYGAGIEVEVFEGKVEFKAEGKVVYLKAGETGFARWGQAPFKPERQTQLKKPSLPLTAHLPEKPVSLSPQGKPPTPLDLPVPKPPRPNEEQD